MLSTIEEGSGNHGYHFKTRWGRTQSTDSFRVHYELMNEKQTEPRMGEHGR